MNTSKEKSNFFHSLKTKIIILVLFSVIISVISNVVVIISSAKSCMKNSVENNLLSLVISYGDKLESNINENNGSLKQSEIFSFLKNLDIRGTKTSYAYLVSSANGEMIYHPEAAKIGHPVANTVIKKVVSDIQSGKKVDSSIATYTYKGKIKYAGYYVSKDRNYILVVTVDQTEILSPLNALYSRSGITLCIMFIVMGILSILISLSIAKPIEKLTDIISKISHLDLTAADELSYFLKRKDEAGLMATAINEMCNSIHSIIDQMQKTCLSLTQSSNELNKISFDVNNNSSINSSLSEELAANMQETNTTTDIIVSNIHSINLKTEDINTLTKNGETTASEISEKADKLRQSTRQSTESTNRLLSSVSEKASEAIANAKTVEKITLLADTIKSISEQTSLLSLNASIEAARAGEAGKGFSIVAGEIGSLASQSADAVNNISDVIVQTQAAYKDMSQCLEMLLSFLDKNIIKDYKLFSNIIESYDDDASIFKNNMHIIHNSTESLKDSISKISSAISDIDTTISDSSNQITNIAEKTSSIVHMTERTNIIANTNANHSTKLKELIDNFKLS